MLRSAFAAALGLLLTGCAQRSAWTLPVRPVDAAQLESLAPTGRLSGFARPVTYRAALDIDPRQDSFDGHVEIDIELEGPATGIWLHGDDLDVHSVTASAGGETLPATWTEVLGSGVAWVGFPQRLEARRLTLAIDYTADFNLNLAGLFAVESGGRRYALAKSESTEARRFMPGFDEPGFKAVFEMSFTVPEGWHVIANTPEVSRKPARAGHETLRFAPTRPLSTYLLSAAVGEFDRVARAPLPANGIRKTPVPLAGYARAGKGDELEFALTITPLVVQAFETMLGQPYPYEKLDLVAAPDWPSGATELAGAITYRESRILKGPNAGPAFVRAVSELHVHEIAHMWFGNLVTPPWWDDLWLKEGFAVWSETTILSAIHPGGGYDVTAVVDGLTAMALDSLASARAVAGPVDRNENIRSAYDAITYSKGQAVIRMVDSYFTPARFRPALGRYIAQYADGSASSADFYAAISKAVGDPAIGRVFEDFVTRPGVPVVSAELACRSTGADIALSQSRYRPLGSNIDPDAQWTLPVCVSWIDGANSGRTCTLLEKPRGVVAVEGAICPSVIIPNADGAGYYRFNLPAEGWQALGEAFTRLPATEALASLDSAEAAFSAGGLGKDAWLAILMPAFAHSDPAVVVAAFTDAEILLRQLENTPAAADLRLRIAAQLDAELAASGPELAARLSGFRAITLQQPSARADLRARLATFFAGNGGLSSDEYVPALRVAFADGGAPAFDEILAARERLDDAAFTQAVADALGSVTDPALACRAEQLMFDGALGPSGSYGIAAGLMANPQHRADTWARLKADFPAFVSVLASQSRRATPRLARSFCDPVVAPELDALFTADPSLVPGHAQALAETKEYLTLCAAQAEAARAAFAP